MYEQESSLKMQIVIAERSDEIQIKQLLAECKLPYDDITLAHLRHFLVLWDDYQLAGVIGLELLGDRISAGVKPPKIGPPFKL